jgi:D-aminopeptidase
MKKFLIQSILTLLIINNWAQSQKIRPREMGLEIGLFQPGQWNAITDVPGVKVGHETIIRGDNVRTGVTIISPHDGNLFENKVMGAVHVTNGFGKALGFTQVEELGTIETPIGLTNTLNIFNVANAIVDYMIINNPNIPPLNPNALVPVPAPIDPSITGPDFAFLIAFKTCFFNT